MGQVGLTIEVSTKKRLSSLEFEVGSRIADKYKVLAYLGGGWEGEVYKVTELGTGVVRAAKLFYPQRNPRNRVASKYAKNLYKLSSCPIITQYHAHEYVDCEGIKVACVVTEFVEGEKLSDFIKRQPGSRIGVFQGLHLLHSLAEGLTSMHSLGEYHGDLHTENVIIKRYGLKFELKLMDLYRWDDSHKANKDADILNSIRIFYDAIGGAKFYKSQPPEVKEICLGLKKSLILKKFKSALHLKNYLESIHWTSSWR